METSLELQGFYPTDLEIANIYQRDDSVNLPSDMNELYCIESG